MTDNDTIEINLATEVEGLRVCLENGNPYASIHLARLIEADTKGALQPFAEALTARLTDHLNRNAELGITDAGESLEDEVYRLLHMAAIDWNGLPKTGRPGEEA